MEWRVRIDEAEYIAKSTDELKFWYREGRVRSTSYVFHPLLARWMYAKELEELKGIVQWAPDDNVLHQDVKTKTRRTALFIVGVTLMGGLLLGWTVTGLFGLMLILVALFLARADYPFAKAATAIVIIAGVLWLVGLLGLSGEGSTGAPEAAKTVRKKETTRGEQARTLLAKASSDTPASAVLSACNDFPPSEPKPRICAEFYLASARSHYDSEKYDVARRSLESARFAGADPALIEELDRLIAPKLKAQKEREHAEKEKGDRENAKLAREVFGAALREDYLDKGLDIKVNVSGKQSDRIKLTFILFNDVWTHQFQKSGMLETMQSLGFKRVSLSDGYDYGVYWTFE